MPPRKEEGEEVADIHGEKKNPRICQQERERDERMNGEKWEEE